MDITVLVQGEPDTKPIMRKFDYENSDMCVFYESVQQIKKLLLHNRRLNIDDVLGLFVAYITTSLDEGRTLDDIRERLPQLLCPHQVMIGVPESLQEITFTVTMNNLYNEVMSILTPIQITDYIFSNSKQITTSEVID